MQLSDGREASNDLPEADQADTTARKPFAYSSAEKATNQEDYEKLIGDIIGFLAKEHALGHDLVAADCVIGLEPDNPFNHKVREFAIKTIKIKAADFDKALKAAKVRERLGVYPQSPTEAVDLLAKELRLTVLFNGRIKRDATPYIDHLLDRTLGSKRDFISPDLANDPAFRMYVQNRFKGDMEYHQFRRLVRIEVAALGLPWHPHLLNDACDAWYDEQKTNRLWQLFSQIDYPDSHIRREQGEAALRRLVETCFDEQEGTEFVVAILKKFIWQVKRKMDRLPIYNHLFMVFINPKQGGGKSTLLRRFIDPVSETAIPVDFKAIADEKIISIWRNFVMYTDEMGWASKSNVEIIKNVISAETVLRRPMTTNHGEDIRQCATFGGSANIADISEIIRDVTGTRRFIGLRTKDKLDWDVVNSTDYLAIWQCVDHEAQDPTVPFWDKLQSRQEEERPRTNVEEWIDQFDPKIEFGIFDKKRRVFQASELHDKFRHFEQQCFPADQTNLTWFGRQLARVPNCPFERIDRGKWRYVRDLPEKGASDLSVIPLKDDARH